jgi:hypothetical protein
MSFFDGDDVVLDSACSRTGTETNAAGAAGAQQAGLWAAGQAAPQASFHAPVSAVGFSSQCLGFGECTAPMVLSGISDTDIAVVMGEARVSRLLAVSALVQHG